MIKVSDNLRPMTFTAKNLELSPVCKKPVSALYTHTHTHTHSRFRYHNLAGENIFHHVVKLRIPPVHIFSGKTGSPVSRSRRAEKQSGVLRVMQPRLTSDRNLFFENDSRIYARIRV